MLGNARAFWKPKPDRFLGSRKYTLLFETQYASGFKNHFFFSSWVSLIYTSGNQHDNGISYSNLLIFHDFPLPCQFSGVTNRWFFRVMDFYNRPNGPNGQQKRQKRHFANKTSCPVRPGRIGTFPRKKSQQAKMDQRYMRSALERFNFYDLTNDSSL